MQARARGIAIRPATGWASTPWRPVWSTPAALRAARATLVIPALFALTFKVIGNLQMASFAAFGSFATLILVTFAGTPKDKLAAHLGLALAGSALLVVGTLVSFSTLVAALATLVVTFAVFFAAILGPNAASGITGALLAYVLPAASAGGPATIPDRLAGWRLASVAGTAAVLIIRTPSNADRLRAAVNRLSAALADTLEAMVRGDAAEGHVRRCAESKSALLSVFNATPFRPTGLATRDRALAEAVELLEWCTSLVADTVSQGSDVRLPAPTDRALLAAALKCSVQPAPRLPVTKSSQTPMRSPARESSPPRGCARAQDPRHRRDSPSAARRLRRRPLRLRTTRGSAEASSGSRGV
jgi:hypothetical protein